VEYVHSEDIAIILLEAGPKALKENGGHQRLRETAEEKSWPRVLAWLDMHLD
jgi:hypothetical protein